MRLDNHLPDGTQHGGMQAFIEFRHARIVPVDGQQVLGQVVGADGEEIHPPGHGLDLVHGGRHLDHDADRRSMYRHTVFQQLAVRLPDQGHGDIQLGHRRHHGQHDGQVVQADAGTQHGTDLGQENLRVIE